MQQKHGVRSFIVHREGIECTMKDLTPYLRAHSLPSRFTGFGAVRAQPGTRADGRNGVFSVLGVPSRAYPFFH
jgi:hypothetical protein